MKKLITLITLIISIYKIDAQLVVSDPGSYAHLAKQAATTLKTLRVAQENIDMGKKALKKLSQVKSVISQGKMVSKIGDNFSDISRDIRSMPKLISELKYQGVRLSYAEKVDNVVTDIEVLTELFSSSIKNNLFEGTDYDRLKMLLDIYKESRKIKEKLSSMKAALQYERFK